MFKFTDNIALNGYSFVIPSISVGNVPQLAVDLIVETLQMKKIGFCIGSGIVPAIGPPAFTHEDKDTTSCELFCSTEKKLAVIQLRTTVAAKDLDTFLTKLSDFLTANQASQVFVLSSCFSHERHDLAMKRNLEYVANQQFCGRFEKELENYVGQAVDDQLVLSGQGFASSLFRAVHRKVDVPIGILFSYVSEGDNVPDAKELALFLVSGLLRSAGHSTLCIPMSWKLLFGNAGPIELF